MSVLNEHGEESSYANVIRDSYAQLDIKAMLSSRREQVITLPGISAEVKQYHSEGAWHLNVKVLRENSSDRFVRSVTTEVWSKTTSDEIAKKVKRVDKLMDEIIWELEVNELFTSPAKLSAIVSNLDADKLADWVASPSKAPLEIKPRRKFGYDFTMETNRNILILDKVPLTSVVLRKVNMYHMDSIDPKQYVEIIMNDSSRSPLRKRKLCSLHLSATRTIGDPLAELSQHLFDAEFPSCL